VESREKGKGADVRIGSLGSYRVKLTIEGGGTEKWDGKKVRCAATSKEIGEAKGEGKKNVEFYLIPTSCTEMNYFLNTELYPRGSARKL